MRCHVVWFMYFDVSKESASYMCSGYMFHTYIYNKETRKVIPFYDKREGRYFYIIDNINFTMAMENMPLTAENKEEMRKCMDGKINLDELIKKTIKKHKLELSC